MKRILDRSFRYTPAAKTTAAHLKRVFDQERRRIAEQKQREQQVKDETALKVRKLGGLPK